MTLATWQIVLGVIVALIAILIVGYLIIKKVHAAASILVVGFALLMFAAILGIAENRATEIEPTGNGFYDQLLVMEAIFKSRFAGIGMSIMVLFGFVAYMRHIGADAKAVVMLGKPLARFHGSYWLVFAGFLVGNLLSLVIPSASALSLLLIATLMPALVAAGLTPVTVGAVIVTSSTIMPSPLEAGLIQGAQLADMEISTFVFGNVARATLPTILIMAFAHMFWQRWCDRRELARGGTLGDLNEAKQHESQARMQDALNRAAALPWYYAILPLLPLVVIAVTAALRRFGVIGFEAGILPATIISLILTVLIEMIRHRSATNTIDSIKSFFVGMGEGAAGVVSLIVAAAVLVEGITQLGVISLITNATRDSSGAAFLVIILFVIAMAVLAVLTGSGVAPYFAFAEVVPRLAANSHILPVRMLTSIWGTGNLMRQVSPVAAAMLIVAGAVGVTPLELVKRTIVPMIVGTVCNVLFAFLFIYA